MNGAFEVGAVALKAQQQALDTLANNIANVNTPTYKRSDVRFAEVMANQVQPNSEVETIARRDMPNSGGVRMTPRDMIFGQGQIQTTGNRLDIAISGNGFIELLGPAGQTLLWRGGSMQVNDDGALASAHGFAFRSLITVPDDATGLDISADGAVRALSANGEILEIGQISLVRADSEASLERLDSGLFRARDFARMSEARPGENGSGLITQGAMEGSNVELTEEMVQLLVVQRAYAANAQIVQAADQISSIINNLKR